MAVIERLLRDERSAVGIRQAGLASALAAASVAAGIFLIMASSERYERASRSVIWAVIDGAGPRPL